MTDKQWVLVALVLILGMLLLSLAVTIIKRRRHGDELNRHATDGISIDRIIDVERNRSSNRA